MAKSQTFLRFSLPQRIEHWLMVLSFTVLAVTGLPQKFAGDGWAETMIRIMGGIEFTRVIHHLAAIVLLLGVVYHLVNLIYKVYVLRVRWTIFPQLQDAFDALNTVLYNAGRRKEAPRMDQFTFGEKFEYWALIWGTIIMAITGFMLWNPIISSRLFPGEVIPAAKAAHGAEAILAVLSVLIWHFYNVHLRSFNRSMFTGQISAHELQEEHALQFERLEKGQPGRTTDADKIRRRQRVYLPIAGIVSLALLFGVFLFVTSETTAVTTIQRQAGAIVTVYSPQTPTATPQRGGQPGGQPARAIPALPADHAGRTTCQACHDSGVAGAPKSPADHVGRMDTSCQDCHKPQGAAAPATATPAATAAASGPTPTTASNGPSVGIPALPADHAGRTTCQACHETGIAGAPKNPADHAGRTDDTCQTCHKPGSAGAPSGGSGTETPAAAEPSPTAAPTTASSGTGGIAALPTDHAGRTQCLVCHQTGVGGAKPIPADHAGRTDETCQSCHKPR